MSLHGAFCKACYAHYVLNIVHLPTHRDTEWESQAHLSPAPPHNRKQIESRGNPSTPTRPITSGWKTLNDSNNKVTSHEEEFTRGYEPFSPPFPLQERILGAGMTQHAPNTSNTLPTYSNTLPTRSLKMLSPDRVTCFIR